MANDQYCSRERLEKNVRIENERKMKVSNVNMELSKGGNSMMEVEDEHDALTGIEEVEMRTVTDSDETVPVPDEEELQTADELEAEKCWEKHVLDNRSVIFDSFQGQFKNTVSTMFF